MIVIAPNPILLTAAKPVFKIDKKIKDIIEHMKQVLISTNNPKGVGLAAPQIGISYRIFITRPTEKSAIDVFINSEIVELSSELSEIIRPESGNKSIKNEKKLEGCLSIPNVWGHLKRPKSVRLKFMDLEGKIQEKLFEGFLASIVQHETDHLNGILFTQRVLEQKEKLYRIEKNEDGKEKLVEIEI